MKLLVMDVEGTVFQANDQIQGTDFPSTMWQPIACALGDEAKEEERRSHEKWANNEYRNYTEWVEDTVRIHRKYGLKSQVFFDLIQRAEYSPGVREFFSLLNREEWIPVLISGGFQNLVRRAQQELGIDYGFGACEYSFDDQGYLVDNISLQPCDFKGKVRYINTLLGEFHLNKKTDWVFVGDGKNDLHIARQAPLAFAIHPHAKLKEINGLIEISSFMELIPYLRAIECELIHPFHELPQHVKTKVIYAEENPDELRQEIHDLTDENSRLRQLLNDQKGKIISKKSCPPIYATQSDYTKTPPVPLEELLKNRSVAFIGLSDECLVFQQLSLLENLTVIPGVDYRVDPALLSNADFIFIYKDFSAHSALWRALQDARQIPFCKLKCHTNERLLKNAMANILFRYEQSKPI